MHKQPRFLVTLLMTIPYEWSADYGRQTALELANRQHIVWCYVQHNMLSLKEILRASDKPKLLVRKSRLIWIYTAIHWLPFKRFSRVVHMNKCINVWIFTLLQRCFMAFRRFDKRIVWIFDPDFFRLVSHFPKGIVLYDSLDFFAGTLFGEKRRQFEASERGLIETADVVVANSRYLFSRARKYREKVYLVPQGFDVAAFKQAKEKSVVFNGNAVIGYVGGINNRLDYKLLMDLIERNPAWQFVFWGPVQGGDQWVKENIARLRSFPNVVMGTSPRNTLSSIIAQFDVGIIPYDLRFDFNKYCFPMKIFEYFYVGIPTVSVPIDELKYYDEFVRIATGVCEWEMAISDLLQSKWTKQKKKKQKELALKNSWHNKVLVVEDYLISES